MRRFAVFTVFLLHILNTFALAEHTSDERISSIRKRFMNGELQTPWSGAEHPIDLQGGQRGKTCAVFATHSTLDYDEMAVTKPSLDLLLAKAKEHQIARVYLRGGGFWFTEERKPEFTTGWPLGGAPIKNFPKNLICVGGNFGSCLKGSTGTLLGQFAREEIPERNVYFYLPAVFAEKVEAPESMRGYMELPRPVYDAFRLQSESAGEDFHVFVDDSPEARFPNSVYSHTAKYFLWLEKKDPKKLEALIKQHAIDLGFWDPKLTVNAFFNDKKISVTNSQDKTAPVLNLRYVTPSSLDPESQSVFLKQLFERCN